jgi:ELWxxDGT repeat protein
MVLHLRRRVPGSRPRRRSFGRRLQVEGLETRSLLSLNAINFGATVTTRSAPVAVGGELFFTADDATHGNQVWETDGTVAGTIPLSGAHEVDGVNGGIFPADLTVVGGEVYFSATDFSHGYQIWETDGTAAGTQMVSDLDPTSNGIFPSDLTAVGSELYFIGVDPTDGTQLFESDGTAAGTRMVADIPGARGYPGCYPTDLTAAGGLLYFSATDATHGTQLWSADPSTGAVTMLTSGNATGGGTVPQFITAVGSTVYFSGYDLTNHEQLWASGGTVATTERLTSGNASQGGMNPQMLTAAGDTLYYSANDGVNGTQLWAMTGTTPGTAAMLTSANVSGGGVDPTNLGAVGGELYFSGDDGVHDAQLWSSNGTAAGTGMVADIDGTSTSNVANPTDINGTLFFTAYTISGGYQIWQSNGTSAGTLADTSLSTGGSVVPAQLTAAGSNLYFTAPGATLWEWKTPTPPTITWSSPASIVYGTALSSAQLDATAGVAGTFTYSPAAGTVLGAGTDTLSVTFTPTDTADYTTATATTTIVVAQAAPTVTWASPAGIVYGTALSSSQLDATASVPGTFLYTPAAGTVPGAGVQTLSVTFTPDDSADYTSPTATTQIIVSQATPTLTWGAPASIVHGTALGSSQLDAQASVPGTFAYSPAAGTILGAGTQTLSVTFTPDDPNDYNTASQTTSIIVMPATPTVTWGVPAAITYGTALNGTQLDAQASVPGTFAYSPAAGTILAAGTRTLSVTFTPDDPNDYTTATQTTSIIVMPATPTVTWNTPASITYGTALNGSQLDAQASVPGTFAYSPAAGTILGAGTQTLSVTFTPDDSTDDTTAAATTTVIVSRATPTVQVIDGGVYSGNPIPATATVAGLGASPASSLEGVIPVLTYYAGTATTGTPIAGAPTTAGTYTVLASFAGSADYAAATAQATFAIAPATPAVAWDAPASIAYGTPLGSNQLDATADVPGSFSYTPAAGTTLGIGPHTLSATFTPTDSLDEATVTAMTTIVIAEFAPALTWSAPASIVYGTPLGPGQLDASASVAGTFAYTPASGTILAAGTRTLSVTFTPTDSADYASATATATILVSPAMPAITWNPPSAIVYGTAMGSNQLDATAGIPGIFTYSADAGAILGVGVHTLSLTFTPSDSDDYTQATATTTITVAAAAPSLRVSDGGGGYSGSPFAATATVAGVGGAPGPSLEGVDPVLTYYAGTTTTGPALGGPPTEVGTYTVVASFPGSADYAGASSPPVTFGIAPAPTAVTLAESAGSVVFGQAVTLTATVTAGAGTPTGTVTFLDGTTTLGTVALDATGRAVLTVAGLGLGGHSIAAVYGGDADRSGGQSVGVSATVSPAGTQIVLVPHAVLKRKKVVALSLTAEVIPMAPGGGVPTGIVTFAVKKKTLGTSALNGGQATLSLKPAVVVNKSIIVSYGGDGAFLATSLTSPPLTSASLAAVNRTSLKGPMARPSVRGPRDGRHLRPSRSARTST